MLMPPNVQPIDLKYPEGGCNYKLGDNGCLHFYKTSRFGWCVATLSIGRDRTYAVTLDGSQVRVGNGPHVEARATVYLSSANAKRLEKYTDLYAAGVGASNDIRDRISSRRAEGQVRRGRGERSWLWNV